jgi:flagellin-like hook-associated protein FlgL
VGCSYSSSSSITNSYATGSVSGNAFVGGLVGQVNKTSGTATISSSYALGDVTGSAKSGSLIGGVVNTTNGTSFGTINISDCYSLDNGMDMIGGCYKYSSSTYTSNTNGYDAMVAGVTAVDKSVLTPLSPTPPATGGGVGNGINLQIGVHGNENSRLSFNTSFVYDLSELELDISSANSLNSIDEFIKTLSSKQTELGAVTNRLESALDEISIQYENLVSSRSTLRDADIAEVSSHYIQQQILQQASATLMSTANQSPSIALQLI